MTLSAGREQFDVMFHKMWTWRGHCDLCMILFVWPLNDLICRSWTRTLTLGTSSSLWRWCCCSTALPPRDTPATTNPPTTPCGTWSPTRDSPGSPPSLSSSTRSVLVQPPSLSSSTRSVLVHRHPCHPLQGQSWFTAILVILYKVSPGSPPSLVILYKVSPGSPPSLSSSTRSVLVHRHPCHPLQGQSWFTAILVILYKVSPGSPPSLSSSTRSVLVHRHPCHPLQGQSWFTAILVILYKVSPGSPPSLSSSTRSVLVHRHPCHPLQGQSNVSRLGWFPPNSPNFYFAICFWNDFRNILILRYSNFFWICLKAERIFYVHVHCFPLKNNWSIHTIIILIFYI